MRVKYLGYRIRSFLSLLKCNISGEKKSSKNVFPICIRDDWKGHALSYNFDNSRMK